MQHTVHHTMQHTMQHTVQHPMQHTIQHTMQHTTQDTCSTHPTCHSTHPTYLHRWPRHGLRSAALVYIGSLDEIADGMPNTWYRCCRVSMEPSSRQELSSRTRYTLSHVYTHVYTHTCTDVGTVCGRAVLLGPSGAGGCAAKAGGSPVGSGTVARSASSRRAVRLTRLEPPVHRVRGEAE